MCSADGGLNVTRAGQRIVGVDYGHGNFGLLGKLQAISLDMRL